MTERIKQMLSRKDSEVDNPYNKKLLDRIRSAHPSNISNHHKAVQSFTKFELSQTLLSETDMPIITDFQIKSPKNNIRKNLRSAITKHTLNLNTESVHIPTSVTIMSPVHKRVESAFKKSIIEETSKNNFFKCVELNKEFMLKNNPNACIKEVARVYGSYKYIHKKY
jgi:hypothetical protein